MKTIIPKYRSWLILAAFLASETLSLAAFSHPWIASAAMGLIGLLALWLSLKNIRYGLLLVAAELVIGSQGYLFSAGGDHSTLSLRIMLWIIVMGVWLGEEALRFLRDRQHWQEYRRLPFAKPLLALALTLGIGVLVGYLNGNNHLYLFLEAKRWVYISIIIPFLFSFRRAEDRRLLMDACFAGALWLAIKTLALAYIFTHGFAPFVYHLYDWSRQDLLAEITRAPSGFFRIFMQSQIFLIPAIFLAVSRFFRERTPSGERSCRSGYLIAAVLCGAALLASLSRSFWVGTIIALAVCLAVFLIRSYRDWRVLLVRSLQLLGLLLASIALLFAIVRFPFPQPSADIGASLLSDRVQLEAGAASRWSLLPVMGREIIKSPLWGFGFGKTLTYVSSDPRITATAPDGRYTTYAFEWGWLDIVLKLGLIGLAAYFWLLGALLRGCWRLLSVNRPAAFVLGGSLLALMAAHFFTPYLNHPLGFLYLGLIMLFLQGNMSEKDSASVPLPKN